VLVPTVIVGLRSLTAPDSSATDEVPETVQSGNQSVAAEAATEGSAEPSEPSTDAALLQQDRNSGESHEDGAPTLHRSQEEQRSAPQVEAAEPDSRNYGIWVIGGHFRVDHPILTLPNSVTGELSYEDMWAFHYAMGQTVAQTATRDQIANSGLAVIKGAEISAAVSDDRVLSNCAEQCLVSGTGSTGRIRLPAHRCRSLQICLSDYERSEDCRILTCKHAFHAACVDEWMLVGRNACPA
jgi:hypothetical protein